MSDQLVAVAATCTIYKKHKEINIHALSAIRTHVPSNHAAADLRPCSVRPPGSASVYKYTGKQQAARVQPSTQSRNCTFNSYAVDKYKHNSQFLHKLCKQRADNVQIKQSAHQLTQELVCFLAADKFSSQMSKKKHRPDFPWPLHQVTVIRLLTMKLIQ